MLEIIEVIVCKDQGIMPNALHTNRRFKKLVECRQITMYFGIEMTALGPAEIGNYFLKDRVTVLCAIKTVNNHIDTEPEFRKRIDIYRERINKYKKKSVNNTLLTIEILKVEIESLKRQLMEKETILLSLQNQMK